MGDIRQVEPENILSVLPLMQELRPHIDEKIFVNIYQNARKADEYTLYGFYDGDTCVGLMGLRYLYDYVHNYHLYIDDLVVTSKLQSKGIGAKLLKYAEELAREKNCSGLRLCTGVENEAGRRFYEREGWRARALAFKKKT